MRLAILLALAGWGLVCGFAGGAEVVISEFQAANNLTLRDEDGNAEDWIELCNLGEEPVNLEGWSLTDDPTRLRQWTFPATNLGPARFLVVFASGKDRRIAGNRLHTNFKLNVSGDYLALVEPDGITVATEFGPAYPPQANDLSYGLPTVAQTLSLLDAGASGRFRVPRDDDGGTQWVVPDFDDSSWMRVKTGVGFDREGVSGLAPWLASDVGGLMHGINASAYLRLPFVATHLADLDELILRIRFNDGFVAYLNGTPVASVNAPVASDGGVRADSLADWSTTGQPGYHNWYYGYYNRAGDADGVYDPEADFNRTDPHWTWNGGAWVLGPANPPWDLISAADWQPNGSNSGGAHWVIRRWVSDTAGAVTCHLQCGQKDVVTGSGSTLRILHNGVERFSATAACREATGFSTNLVLPNLQRGDLLDFALDPLGSDGNDSDSGDASWFSVIIDQSSSLGATWDSSATTARSPAETRESLEINLTRYKDLLVTGTNVLALHALNRSVADTDFLLLPELTASYVGINPSQRAYFTKPTPGADNGPGSATIGPIVGEVHQAPIRPRDADDLVVQARVTPTLRPVQSVTLKYRIMYGAEASLPMYDDGAHEDGAAGDGVYGARIPSSASRTNQMIRYYLVATDTDNQPTRSPAYPDPRRSPQYYGTVVFDPTLTNSQLPVIHWFIQNPTAANSEVPARCSVFFDGEFYDNVGASLHGQSTTGFPKKSYDLHFNPGDHFRWSDQEPRVDNLHLLTTWGDKTHLRSILAHETYRDSGAPSHFGFVVRVHQNGAFYSVANAVENGDEYFLKRLGLDPNGALYKMYNLADSVANNEKKTRKNEGTADLQALIKGLSQTDVTARQAYLFDNLDVPEMIDFLAAKMITADVDCCHKNYYLYRDSDGTGEWQAMPWDVDLCFGRVWTCGSPCQAYFDETIYTNQSILTGYGNRVFTPLFDTPATRQMFLRRLRTLMDLLLQPPGTPPTNDFYRLKTLSLRNQIAPDAALDLAKWGTWGARETITQAVNRVWNEFLPGRRTYLFRTLSVTNRGEIPLAQPTNATVQISAVEYRPASRQPLEEWLSITNANAYAVDLTGWHLDGGVRFQFKPGTVIPSRSALFVSPDVKAFRARTVSPKGKERRLVVGPYSGNLSSWGETLTLSDPSGRLVSSNAFTGNPSPAQLYLRVTEIMYHPSPLAGQTNFEALDLEFLQLRNLGPAALDLTGVRFVNGVLFDFGLGTITQLPAGGRLFLVANTNAFALRYGSGLPVAGQFSGNLENNGERLRLEDVDGEKILDFSYDNKWYPATDGGGASLVVNNETASWTLWGEKTSWRPNPRPGPAQYHPPVAGDDGLLVPQGQAASLAVSTLLANDHHPDGDSMTVVAVAAGSGRSATVTLADGRVIYSPSVDFAGPDRFSYTLMDASGLWTTGHVEVLVYRGALPSFNQCSIAEMGTGYRIRFLGAPGRTCELQRSADLGQWVHRASARVPPHGVCEFLETNVTAGASFYRAEQQ